MSSPFFENPVSNETGFFVFSSPQPCHCEVRSNQKEGETEDQSQNLWGDKNQI